ncbi:hypothetical protein EPA93_46585 [Ktedonosporobacter rubrisoli]|uniref:HEAT repeat domain-containing protein n=1 Tax=Ktedonosporobacter rubrisoli TaxID=2509675 RepID=A0A4P6K424_KTERU|nr:HEAT repeat domain-containing protein [Ktedonosporobacter rubrisoli]QBD83038.1 hypothetical protein EPA93_46585 [Ktedonosporobacter rubrisoli]
MEQDQVQQPEDVSTYPQPEAEFKAPTSLLIGILNRLEERENGFNGRVSPSAHMLKEEKASFLSYDSCQTSECRANPSLELYVARVNHPQWEIRSAAIHALGMSGKASYIDLLTNALQDEHRLVRMAAVRALARLGLDNSLEQIVMALKDRDWEVREMAALVLGESNNPANRPLLLSALQDTNSNVRSAASYALSRWPEQKVVKLPATVAEMPPSTLTTSVQQNLTLQRDSWLIALSSRLRHYLLVFSRQLPLIPKSVWLVTALCMFTGCVLEVVISPRFMPAYTHMQWMLSVLCTVASAIGVAYLQGQENDAGMELVLSTATSIRTVLLSRMAIVVGYNVALAASASALITLIYNGSFWEMAQLWLGPLVFLSSISLVLSLAVGSMFAILASLTLVATQTLTFSLGKGLQSFFVAPSPAWQTNPLMLSLALLIIALAILFAPDIHVFRPRTDI